MKKFFKQRWEQRNPERVEIRRLGKGINTLILPTKFGWGLLLVLLIMFIWSANHQLNLGYAFLFLVATTAFFSAILTAKELANVEISAKNADGVFVGERAAFMVNLSEHRHLQINDEEIQFPHTVYQFAAARGRMFLDTLEISSVYPFEFFRAWQWARLNVAVVVYPVPMGSLPLPITENVGGIGINLQSTQGEEELSHLREYIVGDSLARVAWKQSGRGGSLLFKQFSGMDSVSLILEWNHTTGSTEERLSQLAKWILEAENLQILYGLKLPNLTIKANRGAAHRHECLTALALF